MKDLIAQLKRLSPSQQLIIVGVIAVVLFLLRNILILIVALVAIAGILWFLNANAGAITSALNGTICLFGGGC